MSLTLYLLINKYSVGLLLTLFQIMPDFFCFPRFLDFQVDISYFTVTDTLLLRGNAAEDSEDNHSTFISMQEST